MRIEATFFFQQKNIGFNFGDSLKFFKMWIIRNEKNPGMLSYFVMFNFASKESEITFANEK